MAPRAPSRGPGRPGPKRQFLRIGHVLFLGAVATVLSLALFASGPAIHSLPADSAAGQGATLSLAVHRRHLERRETSSPAGNGSLLVRRTSDAGSASGTGSGMSEASGSLQGSQRSEEVALLGGQEKASAADSALGLEDPSAEQLRESRTALPHNATGDSDSGLNQKAEELQGREGSPDLYEHMPIRQLPISHEMEDEELLWRASFISLRDPLRRLGPRKIAFLFTFNSQLFFAPLWARFFDKHEGRFSVYLHGAESSIDKSMLPSVFQHRFVPIETHTATGDPFPHMYGVDATRRLVANALLDMSNDWFIMVCDLCIPLHDFDYFYSYFSSSPTRSFVPNQTPPYKNGQDRFIAACFEPLVMPEQWRKGGPWLGLTRRMALALVSDIKYYDKFASCCQPVKRGGAEPCFPLEHYLATTLPILGTGGTAYMQPEEVTNWSVVFEDWWTEAWAGRPFVYNSSYVSEKLLKAMRRCHLGNLCHLQGAHFSPLTLPLLMNMTEALGF